MGEGTGVEVGCGVLVGGATVDVEGTEVGADTAGEVAAAGDAVD